MFLSWLGFRYKNLAEIRFIESNFSTNTMFDSTHLRYAVAGGYIVLIAVNGVIGSGAFGVASNGQISRAYPSHVTPASFTFGTHDAY